MPRCWRERWLSSCGDFWTTLPQEALVRGSQGATEGGQRLAVDPCPLQGPHLVHQASLGVPGWGLYPRLLHLESNGQQQDHGNVMGEVRGGRNSGLTHL